ncbi:MAG: flagellar brake protein [Vallitaleaceae bacterium]|nr:flagellar brake protein [Vallitaleaceae bacterium]
MINSSVELGDKIEVIRKTGLKTNQHSFFSKIQEIPDENQIIITAPIENGKIIPLEMNWEYYLCIYTANGLYRCESEVVDRKRVDHMFYATLKLKTKMQKYQRRQYYRLDCVLSFHYKNDEKEVWNNGLILDISGGGLRFTSNAQLVPLEQVVCHIQLNFEDDQKHLYVNGSIIDCNIIDFNANIYETRVAFDTISNDAREIVIRFIFEEERKRRKKEKGM